MSELKATFEKAVEEVKGLRKRPDNDGLLKLYSLFKQATDGDVSGKRPGFTDFKGRAKYDAWTKCKGQPSEDAMQSYIDFVEQLKKTHG